MIEVVVAGTLYYIIGVVLSGYFYSKIKEEVIWLDSGHVLFLFLNTFLWPVVIILAAIFKTIEMIGEMF
jgi:hypothetical protein